MKKTFWIVLLLVTIISISGIFYARSSSRPSLSAGPLRCACEVQSYSKPNVNELVYLNDPNVVVKDDCPQICPLDEKPCSVTVYGMSGLEERFKLTGFCKMTDKLRPFQQRVEDIQSSLDSNPQ